MKSRKGGLRHAAPPHAQSLGSHPLPVNQRGCSQISSISTDLQTSSAEDIESDWNGSSETESLIGRKTGRVHIPNKSILCQMMHAEDRKKRSSSKGVAEEYCLRERPNEYAVKMKNKVTSTQAVRGKKKAWSWDQYLGEEKVIAAPLRLFTEGQSFPPSRSGFKAGMRLEGIDPLHPSMFCVLSVAEVIGYRLRLHIDSYSECYDFWVNADSPDIRPAGWCESTGHQLHPPKGYNESEFNWEKYQEACNAQAAPKNLFKSQNGTMSTSKFQVGMKLEAVDRKNPCLVCDASSPHIHPVGWCQDHGRPLTAPQGHPNPEHFLWEEYLQDNGSTAVPSQAFCMRAPHSFQVNMKLEAVDRRNPMLVRVATVSDTEDYRVKIRFDGWHEKFDFWVDSDLPDLHPSSVTQGVCPTPGCRGVGHIKGAKYTGHHRLADLVFSVGGDRAAASRVPSFSSRGARGASTKERRKRDDGEALLARVHSQSSHTSSLEKLTMQLAGPLPALLPAKTLPD
ncbi:unnamed protein product [Coregonus sp. 'balchen']|nr:unnamed protein product [Coregonus sp. 'balchen']